MNTNRDIVILCNHRMAFPAIQTLHNMGRLSAVAIPAHNEDIRDFCLHFASQAGINLVLLEKGKLKTQLEELIKNKSLKHVFTMTFPWKIPGEMIKEYPNLFYNFHYGLLPEMRGSDPVFESIRQQKKETGITVHVIEKEIDNGAIILKKIVPLDTFVTHGLLCTNLSYLGSNIILEVLTLLQNNTKGIQQEETLSNYYKRPAASDVCINWENQNAKSIEALIRACNPWNKGAYTQWNGWNFRILEASLINYKSEQPQNPGTILNIDEKNGLIIQCYNDTQLCINIIYTDEAFMSGHKLLIFGLKNGEQLASL